MSRRLTDAEISEITRAIHHSNHTGSYPLDLTTQARRFLGADKGLQSLLTELKAERRRKRLRASIIEFWRARTRTTAPETVAPTAFHLDILTTPNLGPGTIEVAATPTPSDEWFDESTPEWEIEIHIAGRTTWRGRSDAQPRATQPLDSAVSHALALFGHTLTDYDARKGRIGSRPTRRERRSNPVWKWISKADSADFHSAWVWSFIAAAALHDRSFETPRYFSGTLTRAMREAGTFEPRVEIKRMKPANVGLSDTD